MTKNAHNIKTIILAAGKGRRLGNVTESIPKCLIELNGKTVLENMIKNCVDTGITDFVIVVGHKNELIKQKLSDIAKNYKINYDEINYDEINYDIVHNCDYASTNSGVSLDIAFGHIANNDNNDDIIIMNADVIFDKKILQDLVKRNTTTMVIDDKKILTEESFKVKIEDSKIVSMGKDIPIENSTGEFIGLSIIKSKDIRPIKDILKRLIVKDKNQYYSCIYKIFSNIENIDYIFVNGSKWTDIDVPEDLKYAEEIIGGLYI